MNEDKIQNLENENGRLFKCMKTKIETSVSYDRISKIKLLS